MSRTRRAVVGVATTVLVVASLACSLVGRAAAPRAVALAEEAFTWLGTVVRAVERLDAPAARSAVAKTEELGTQAVSAAEREGTQEALAAGRKASAAGTKAKSVERTGWLRDELRAQLRDEAMKQIRAAFRRAACDAVVTARGAGERPDTSVLVAKVVLFIRPLLPTDLAVRLVVQETKSDLDYLSTLDPRDAESDDVLAYLADTVLCPGASNSLDLSHLGWGVTLHNTLPVYDANYQQIGQYDQFTLVQVLCTFRGPEVGGSDLWDHTPRGNVPDAGLYTGTNDPVATSC